MVKKKIDKGTKTRVLEVRCPKCGSENVYGVSRVVGYYSRIENWNPGKKAELKDRQKGTYEVRSDEGKSKK